jgi:hypothetical protein
MFRIMVIGLSAFCLFFIGLIIKAGPAPQPFPQQQQVASASQATIKLPSAPAPLDKVWSPEEYRDFVYQVIANCRLPHGDRNRPSVAVCGY